MTEFDITKLEEALSPKRDRAPKKEKAPKKGRGPLFIPVDKSGKEIALEDIKVGKTYELKLNK